MPTQQTTVTETNPVEPPQPAAPAQAGAGQEPGAPQEPPAIDWEAEAERLKKESRKWEALAKKNKGKADLWDAQGAQAPTVESLNDELNDLKVRLAASEAERERERTLARVSQATGVPAALIHGDDEESMTESAKAVADFAESRQPGYPLDKGGSGGGKKVNRESIESIKDPAKRIMARAAHMDLYK